MLELKLNSSKFKKGREVFFVDNERKNNREVIPFEVNRIPDTELSEGEEMILIQGQEGVRVWGNDNNVVNEIKPHTQVIAYGPKSIVIPADEVRTSNRNLEEGVENLIAEGFSGIQLVDENGRVVKEYESAPTEIEYGPIREEIPFEIIRKPDNNLREGEENILVFGETGLQLVDEEGNAELIDEPRTEEIEYGPKRVAIPFEIKREPNQDLPEGESQVVISGSKGLELEDEEGNITSASDPVAEIIEYGPARVKIPYETIRKSNSELAEGAENVTVAGEKGLQLEDEEGVVTPIAEPLTETIEYGPVRHFLPFDTERVSNPDLDEGVEQVITPGEEGVQFEDEEGNITEGPEPVTEVVEYGPIRHYLLFETERVSKPELAEGKENVTIPGQEGIQLEDEEGNMTHVSDPVTKVIEYGPARVRIPYEIIRTSNPEIIEGEENVIVAGEEGLQLEDEKGTVTPVSDPVTEEIEYGPIRHYLSFETERVSNPDLAEGEERVATAGKEEIQFEDEEETITPGPESVTEVIEYGPIRHYLPFATERVPNPDLTEGEERVATAGKEEVQFEDEGGNITPGSESVTQIIEYGPVRISLPYITVRSVNTDLKQGEERIRVPGQEGIRLEDEHRETIETKHPIAEEIQYGPVYKVIPYETIRHPYTQLEEGDVIPLSPGINGIELLDEEGNIVESHVSFAKEIAYGPDEKERKESENRKS